MADALKATIELSQEQITEAVRDYVAARFGTDMQNVELCIEVKSLQNYRAEWEQAKFRGKFTAVV